MLWEITCYNGDKWTAPMQMPLEEAVASFKKETNKSDWDIKSIINKH